MTTTTEPQPLTARQREVYEYIAGFAARGEPMPTLREIGLRFDISSPNGAAAHLRSLQRKGWLVPTVENGRVRARCLALTVQPVPEVRRQGDAVMLGSRRLTPEQAKVLARRLVGIAREILEP